MGLMDILIVLIVFGGFGYIILVKMYKNNPERTRGIFEWFTKTKDKMDKTKEEKELNRQIYIEKREVL